MGTSQLQGLEEWSKTRDGCENISVVIQHKYCSPGPVPLYVYTTCTVLGVF